jgi:hypothetical protein
MQRRSIADATLCCKLATTQGAASVRIDWRTGLHAQRSHPRASAAPPPLLASWIAFCSGLVSSLKQSRKTVTTSLPSIRRNAALATATRSIGDGSTVSAASSLRYPPARTGVIRGWQAGDEPHRRLERQVMNGCCKNARLMLLGRHLDPAHPYLDPELPDAARGAFSFCETHRTGDGNLHELNWTGVAPVNYSGNLTAAISAPHAVGDPTRLPTRRATTSSSTAPRMVTSSVCIRAIRSVSRIRPS